MLFSKSKKVTYIDKELYYYYVRADSILGTMNGKGIIDKLELIDERDRNLRNLYPELDELLKQYYFYSGVINIVNLCKANDYETYNTEFINEKYKYVKDFIKRKGWWYIAKTYEKNIVVYAMILRISKKLLFKVVKKSKR